MTATTSGLVFFAIDKPLVLEHEVAFKLIRRLHAWGEKNFFADRLKIKSSIPLDLHRK